MTVLFFAALLFKESSLVIISFWAGVRYFCASVLVIAVSNNMMTANFLFMAQNWGCGGKGLYGIGKYFAESGNLGEPGKRNTVEPAVFGGEGGEVTLQCIINQMIEEL